MFQERGGREPESHRSLCPRIRHRAWAYRDFDCGRGAGKDWSQIVGQITGRAKASPGVLPFIVAWAACPWVRYSALIRRCTADFPLLVAHAGFPLLSTASHGRAARATNFGHTLRPW